MKTYSLKENTDDGSIELIETRPVTVATFQTRELADRVLDMLLQPTAHRDHIASPPAGVLIPAATVVPLTAVPGGVDALDGGRIVSTSDRAQVPVRTEPVSAASTPAEPKKAKVQDPPTAAADPSPEDWAAAFEALRGGANMDEVAATLGVTFFQLRGRYANWRRNSKQPRPLATGTEECRMCGKEFAASASSDSLCARCRA